MPDTHVEAAREMLAGRAKGSCAGAVLGVFVLVGAVFLLTWNERRVPARVRHGLPCAGHASTVGFRTAWAPSIWTARVMPARTFR